MIARPSSSTVVITGLCWIPPLERLVASTARWRSRMKSRARSRSIVRSVTGSGGDTLRAQRRLHGLVERARDRLRGGALLGQDPVDHIDRRLVAHALGDPLQQLIPGDLEVLEGKRERGQLA